MISGTEYLVIALAIFLVFGPRRLPELSRRVGGWVRDARQVVAQLRESIEAEAGDVTGPLRDVADEARRLRDEGLSAFEWKGPIHGSGPTPDDSLGDLEDLEAGRPPGGDAPPEPTTGSADAHGAQADEERDESA